MAETIELLVEGGKATAGPPLGPALGPTKIDVGEVVGAINEETADFEGTEVPVTVTIEDGEYEIEVGLPPTSALIKDELGFDTGSGRPQAEFVAEMTAEELKKVAEMKADDLLSYDTKNAAKEIAGSCVCLGVKIEGEDPREAARRIDEGEFDDVLV
ncbi:MAG: 50S ribosomal protein L11 [Halobacteriales archaeon]|nr:50S ribosomal protein L11 [Halobacteriales archaeon]